MYLEKTSTDPQPWRLAMSLVASVILALAALPPIVNGAITSIKSAGHGGNDVSALATAIAACFCIVSVAAVGADVLRLRSLWLRAAAVVALFLMVNLTIWRQVVLDDPADLRLSAPYLFLFLGLIAGSGSGPGLRVVHRCATVLALGTTLLIVFAYCAGWLRLKF